MGNFEKSTYGKEGFFYGDNFSESGVLTADAEVKMGTILIRNSGKKWVPATASTFVAGAGIGIAIRDVEAGTEVPTDIGISGRFNENWVKLEGNSLTDAQRDLLRTSGILAIRTNSID